MVPLAQRARPKSIDEVVGQQHLIAKDKPLYNIIHSGTIPNMIFYGPSGVGKTTIAKIIAEKSGMCLYKLNATTAKTDDIKKIIAKVGTLETAKGILLYLDEIQYFNKKQQQILLEFIENGDITLIASTTENPFFYVYPAILSRCVAFEFKPVSDDDIIFALKRIVEMGDEGRAITVSDLSLKRIARCGAGDVRKALNMLEVCLLSSSGNSDNCINITDEISEELCVRAGVNYDKDGDYHYDIISAYQKSMRGSDPDAALYYLARLLEAGDLPSACRRLMVCACEDVGLANPKIIPIVKSCVDIAQMVGLPEARIPLADAVVMVSISPKSNSVYKGINNAMSDIKNGVTGAVPRNLQNVHLDGAENDNPGQNYIYPHDYKNHYVYQQYLPDNLKDKRYYYFGDNKNESAYRKYWETVKNKKL